MIRWINPPKNPDVAKYVECYWYLNKTSISPILEHPKLNPDPAAHLIISLPDQKHQYTSMKESLVGDGSHWLYPHRNTYQMDHSGAFSIVGIKFHIGALYSLTATPNAPVINQIEEIDVHALFTENAFDIVDFLTNEDLDADRYCGILDKLLCQWLPKFEHDKHAELTQRILPLLSTHDINQLGEALHSSQRTLERSFLRVTGLTMKQCQSMKRLEALLEHLYQRDEKNIDWADIAYEFGFSDQPHLIRHLKETIGSTPAQYTKRRDLTIDIYGGVTTS